MCDIESSQWKLYATIQSISSAGQPAWLYLKALQPNARRCRESRACSTSWRRLIRRQHQTNQPSLHAEAGVEDPAHRCSDELWLLCLATHPCLEEGQRQKASHMEPLTIAADNRLLDALVEGFLPLVKFQVPSLPCALRYAPVLWRQ